jgi:hypothetical protein
MGKSVERLMIGIFGPSDCAPEKERLRRLISNDLSLDALARQFDLVLKSCSGDDVASSPGRPQERINRYIEERDPDLSIFVFKDNFGSNAGIGLTGSEEEWGIAISTLAARPEFDLGLYFARQTPSDARLGEFRKRIEREYIAYYKLFDDLADFDSQLRHKLTTFLLDLGSRKNNKPQTAVTGAVEAFLASPLSVSTYPRSLPGGEKLPRPELKTLLDRINSTETSATVILGERGSGKSALVATLEAELRSAGVAVLSIKADMLSATVRDEAALDRALRLPLGLTASVQVVAAERTVAVLVDQLDALADVLDRKTERLNIVLNAIRSISGVPNVHLVISSRPLEFHHDVRLRSMAAEQLDLELPPWEQVEPILDKHGYAAESISEAMRELLRNPWTLNEFLRLRPKNVNFESLFALLEEVWSVTVQAPNAPSATQGLVEAMVKAMSRDEVLWIPRSIAAGHEEARQYLQECDVIQLDESGLRLAFRHQSFYEFALVRRFAAGAESFAAFVLEGSQGLFIRPVALAGLAYLRGTVSPRYEAELRALWDGKPRVHLCALIVDFIAAQSVPLPTEISIITEMLRDERQGPRALAAIAPYSAWFAILHSTAAFIAWLRRPPTEAALVTGLLATHAAKSPEDVLDVIEREWLHRPDCDRLTFSLFYHVHSWSERALEVLMCVVTRSPLQGVYYMALQMIEANPHFAARLLRAEMDRRLAQILKSETADLELQRAAERLVEDDEHTGVFADLAETSPEAFLSALFPWIVGILDATAYEDEPRFQHYRHGRISLTSFGSMPVAAMIDVTIGALEQLAKSDGNAVLALLQPFLARNTMGIHALAVYALRVIAPAQPAVVSEYLLADPRRLAIGSWARAHQLSKLLIETVVPYLMQTELRKLESVVLAYDYLIAPDEELTEEQRTRKAPWNREHRLFLLQSFPGDLLSEEALNAKQELEAEFPGLDESIFGEIKGGVVEAPYPRAELEGLNDDEILARLEEVPDQTGWNHPRRWSQDRERLIGGAIQQARVIGELAESDPERVIRLARRFHPHDQEIPTSEALGGLVKTDLDPQRLLSLILELAAKGFESDDFKTSAARALTKLSEKLGGLSDEVLSLLRQWLDHLDSPSAEEDREEQKTPPEHALVFAPGGLFLEPQGRGPVIEAIAAGYLDRECPDIAEWAQVVRERLDVETNARVWVMTIRNLQSALREEAALGTELFSAIFERHPKVLREQFTWLLIAHWMRAFSPAHAVLRWLDILAGFADARSQQAMGELLYLFAVCEEAGRERVRAYSDDPDAQHVVRGFAYAAAYLWGNVSTRGLGLDVFTTEIRRWPEDAAKTLNSLLIANREEIELDEPTQKVFRAAAMKDTVLLDIFADLGEEIEPRTVQEPAFVAEIARAFVAAPTQQVEDRLGPIHRGNVPEVITSIALTLHRIPAFATVGLDLFEKLLDANLREAQGAMELLDRKPSRQQMMHARRPRRSRRRARRH